MNIYEIRSKLSLGTSLKDISLRVTYYARVSTDHKEQINSLDNQISYFEKIIKDNKKWSFIEGYIDEGISGTNDINRLSFMRMIEDSKKDLFDLIITKEISRFSRNTLDSIKYTRELLENGVGIYFVNDNINTILPDSELRLTIMSSIAQDEIRKLSERVKFGMKESINKGVILGNNLLYGYRKNKETGNLKIKKEEAKIVKKIFDLYAYKNYSINKIVKNLNEEKIPTIFGNKWSIPTISRMIRNPKYKGYYCGNKVKRIDYISKKNIYLKEDKWIQYKDNKKIPPIIDEKTWQKANDKIKNIKNNICKKDYLLSNKIICQKDKFLYHRRKQCKEDISWICSNSLINGQKKCNGLSIREKEFFNIFERLQKIIDLNRIATLLLDIYIKEENLKKKDKIKIYKYILNTEINKFILNEMIYSIQVNNKKDIKIHIFLNVPYKSRFPTYISKYYKRGYQQVKNKKSIVRYKMYCHYLLN